MATRRPLVIVDGRLAELPIVDTLPGGGGGVGYEIGTLPPADPVATPFWYNTDPGTFLVHVGSGVFVEAGVNYVPVDGVAGQALIKLGIGDFDVAWGTPTVTWTDLTGTPATFAPSAHAHAIADVTGLDAALAGKQAAGSYLLSSAVGVTVQGYNASTVVDAAYVHTDNNYTTAEQSKLAGIAAGAEVNVQADWTAVAGDALILNKPTLGSAAATNTTDYTPAAHAGAGGSAHAAATTVVDGFMSAADKTKLDGVATGATANVGTVTSVGMTVPAGLAVSGSPITGTGSFGITFTAGYSIPTDAAQTAWSAKQDALVSGTSIKTINGTSLLGSGDIVISGGGGGGASPIISWAI